MHKKELGLRGDPDNFVILTFRRRSQKLKDIKRDQKTFIRPRPKSRAQEKEGDGEESRWAWKSNMIFFIHLFSTSVIFWRLLQHTRKAFYFALLEENRIKNRKDTRERKKFLILMKGNYELWKYLLTQKIQIQFFPRRRVQRDVLGWKLLIKRA